MAPEPRRIEQRPASAGLAGAHPQGARVSVAPQNSPPASARTPRRIFAPLAIAVLVLATFALAPSPQPVHAQAAPTVTDGGVDNNFPQGMVFHMSAESGSQIQKIRLRYSVLPDGAAAIAEPDFTPGKTVSATFGLAGNNPPKIYLPPGTTIQYHWEVTDGGGGVGKTEQATFVYEDVRFDWTPLTQGGVTINYYSGSEKDAQSMLAVASDGIASMSQLLGANVDFPVKVWAYDSTGDMRPALARRSEAYEQSIITAGVRVSSDTVLVLGNVSFDTLRHELTHVVTAVAGESAFGTLPAWLDEGTAVYSQKDPGGFKDAVDRAAGRGNILSVRSITSYPGEPSKVELFYGEAWSLVSYLNDAYGQEKFAQLFAEIKSGKRIDSALETVYSFGQDGLEDQWRASLGLPARETPAPATATTAATGRPASTSAASGPATTGAGGGGTSTGVIIGLAAGIALLAALVALAGLTVARRYR